MVGSMLEGSTPLNRMISSKIGWLVRFDPAEIAAWLDGARHPHRRATIARAWCFQPAGVVRMAA